LVADELSAGLCFAQTELLKGDCEVDMIRLWDDGKASVADGEEAVVTRNCKAKRPRNQDLIVNVQFSRTKMRERTIEVDK
jgi:hypothetical protein